MYFSNHRSQRLALLLQLIPRHLGVDIARSWSVGIWIGNIIIIGSNSSYLNGGSWSFFAVDKTFDLLRSN
jgi:hypothetical protein